jgi:hypothetical protein
MESNLGKRDVSFQILVSWKVTDFINRDKYMRKQYISKHQGILKLNKNMAGSAKHPWHIHTVRIIKK